MSQLGLLMEREIGEQPAVLASNCARYFEESRAALRDDNFELVMLAGRGTSDHAALYARYLIEVHLSIPATMAAPSVFTRFQRSLRAPKCLVIGISQSGAAPDVGAVLRSMRQAGHTTVGISNTGGSHLTDVAEVHILLEAGEEKSLPATKTYTSSMLALYQLVRAIGAQVPDPTQHLPSEPWLEICRAASREAVIELSASSPVFALARGFSFCSALEQALKLIECAMIPCLGYSSADFAHGPRILARQHSAVVLFGGVEAPAESHAILCPPIPSSIAEEIRPIWEAFFLQSLALEAARLRGLDPDTPPSLSKVTRTH